MGVDAVSAGSYCSRGSCWVVACVVCATTLAVAEQAAEPDLPTEWREPKAGMTFVRIEPGCFLMGSDASAAEAEPDEWPRHEVCLSGFWIGKSEVTQGQWRAVTGTNPSARTGQSELPVTQVSWGEAREFAGRLESLARDGTRFRLPTEAEWEFACTDRGLPAHYAGDYSLDVAAWSYAITEPPRIQPVAGLMPTDLGLFDMSGNAHEWTEDGYAEDGYVTHDLYDPSHLADDDHRVIRGGSVLSLEGDVRCAARNWLHASSRLPTVGFRLVAIRPEGD